jgi:hypothetical protein
MCIQTGNSDDRLTQIEWANFCRAVNCLIAEAAVEVLFHGHSPGGSRRQNACWVFDVSNVALAEALAAKLAGLCDEFKQDSIAMLFGTTEFLKPGGPK